MDLVCVSPPRAGFVVWQRRSGALFLTVYCKVTYDLVPGEAKLASKQDEPLRADQHWDNDAARSIYAPADSSPAKPRADVVLVGSAFAPGGRPVPSLVARLIVAGIDKSIELHGSRALPADGPLQHGGPFDRMPLTWECAAGGPGTANPVGVRCDVRDPYGRVLLPNLQPVGAAATGSEPRIAPIGFGPMAASWPGRAVAPSAQPSWSLADWPSAPLPDDLDLGCFNVAPRDQQVAALRDDEPLVLENLHRQHAHLATKLPGVRPVVFVDAGQGPQRVPVQPDLLWIDTDVAMVTLTFRGEIPVLQREPAGRIVVAMESGSETLGWSDVERMLAPKPKAKAETVALPAQNATMMAGLVVGAKALPFADTPGGPLVPADRPSRPDGALPFSTPPPSLSPQSLRAGAFPAVTAVPQPAAARLPPLPAPVAAAAASPPASLGLGARSVGPTPPLSAPSSLRSPGLGGGPLLGEPAPVPPSAASSAGPSSLASPWANAAARESSAAASVPYVAPEPPPPAARESSVGPFRPQMQSLGEYAARAAAVPVQAPAIQPTAPSAEPTPLRSDPLVLLWFEPECVPRLRRTKAFRPVLDALEHRPVDRELDDSVATDDPMEIEDRRELFEVLARGSASHLGGVRSAVEAAMRKDGKFVPQLVLLAGELGTPFDPLEKLRATISTVKPLMRAEDEELKGALERATDFLATPGLLCPASVLDGFRRDIEEHFDADARSLPEAYLGDATDRVLLERRSYDKRIVFGAPHLRTLLEIAGDELLVPTYLPEELAPKLPLYRRFKVRLLAEALVQEDQDEKVDFALRAVALVRVAQRPAPQG